MVCFIAVDQAAIDGVSNWEAEEVNYEGLRVVVDEGGGKAGWLMNRMSLHEPIVIFNVESVRPIYHDPAYGIRRKAVRALGRPCGDLLATQ